MLQLKGYKLIDAAKIKVGDIIADITIGESSGNYNKHYRVTLNNKVTSVDEFHNAITCATEFNEIGFIYYREPNTWVYIKEVAPKNYQRGPSV